MRIDSRINDYLGDTASLLDRLDRATIAQAAELLLECYRRQGRVWTLESKVCNTAFDLDTMLVTWPASDLCSREDFCE